MSDWLMVTVLILSGAVWAVSFLDDDDTDEQRLTEQERLGLRFLAYFALVLLVTGEVLL